MAETPEYRIAVVGCSCSGKSTLARRVAARLGVAFVEQDEIFWMPGWAQRPKSEFATIMNEKTSKTQWVVCGNHSHFQDQILKRATHLVWLNYSFSVIWQRALKRTFRRVFLRETCCNGNYESFRHAFLSKNSILWWVLKTYRARKRRYRQLVNSSAVSQLRLVELSAPSDAELWFSELPSHSTSNHSVS